jgi:hypothetical protein
MLCVVNRKYDFDAEELFYQKMKGVPAATATESAAHFIDLVLADDFDDDDEDDFEDCVGDGQTRCSQVDASATLVREAFLGGDPDVERLVAQRLLTAAAWDYIRKHHLLPPRPKYPSLSRHECDRRCWTDSSARLSLESSQEREPFDDHSGPGHRSPALLNGG